MVSGANLLQSLSSFVSFILSGKVLALVCLFLFGTNLVAFKKRDGGIHRIAFDCTLHRLVAKCVGLPIKEEMGYIVV